MFKKLKSLFVIEEEGKQGPGTVQSEKKDADISNVSIPDTVVAKTPSGKADSKFVDILLKAIEANNLEGYDYLEYKQSLQALSKMDMDEKTRYQAAFAAAKSMQVSAPSLLQSANHYITVLKSEDSKFKEALSNQRKKQVDGREQKIKSLETNITQKQKQIEQLTKDIEAHKKQLSQIKGEIKQSADKVESTNTRFQSAYNSVLNQIITDMEKMKKYLS